MKLEIFLENRPWTAETAIWIISEDHYGNRHVAKPMELVFNLHSEGCVVEPTLLISGAISRDFLPALRDAIIKAGYQDTADTKALAFLKDHLKDMRRLVFDQPNNESVDG